MEQRVEVGLQVQREKGPSWQGKHSQSASKLLVHVEVGREQRAWARIRSRYH